MLVACVIVNIYGVEFAGFITMFLVWPIYTWPCIVPYGL